jgi:hypothetical protein
VTQASASVRGIVADGTGAIIPGAEIDLIDQGGAVAGKYHSDDSGNFQVTAPHPGLYTLVISEPGFKTVQIAVTIAAPGVPAAPSKQPALLP